MAENPTQDGSTTFTGGQNASKSAALVPDGSYYAGVNVKTTNGTLTPRWGNEEHQVILPGTTFTIPKTNQKRKYADVFPYGKFQALIPYSIGGTYYLIIVISGTIYLVNQETFEATILPITDGSTLNETTARINWTPAGKWLEIFDYPNRPVIVQGTVARRTSAAALETPISVLGTYNENRVFIGNALNEFTASDPAAYGFPNGPISFEEFLTIGSPYYGQSFQLSTNYANDPITAMTFLQRIDSSTGIGSLVVATQNAIYSYQTQNPRELWESQGFGSVFIPGIGIAGPRAFCNVNSDLFFIDPDGNIRSASMSRQEQNQWSKVPISKEVSNYMTPSNPELLYYSTMCYFKNQIFVLANPYRVIAIDSLQNPTIDYAHGGMVKLNLDNVSTLTRGDASPTWDGLQTGIRPMDMVVNNRRCFIIGKDGGVNKLFEIRDDLTYDVRGPEKRIQKIPTKIYTKEYAFQSPFSNKNLQNLELAFTGIKGEFELKVSYKTSPHLPYIEWGSFTHTAPWRSCGVIKGCDVNGLLGHDIQVLNLGSPIDPGCNPITENKYIKFRSVQLLLEIKGIDWELESFILRGVILPQTDTKKICNNFKPVKVCKDCINDWEIEEEATLCQKI